MKKPLVSIGMAMAAALTLFPHSPLAEDEPLTVDIPRLGTDVTVKMAQAALEACRKRGIPISVSIVDRNGLPQIQLRDTTAPPVSYRISLKKAYTAVMFNAKGSELQNRAQSPLSTLGEGLAFMAGSVPIRAGGRLYGAIGVSGAPDGMDDEKCAQAGLDAVIEDLEMM